MSRPGVFTLMYKNWKKSTFYSVVASGAVGYFYDYTITRNIMANSCKNASVYGDQRLYNPLAPVRHITVILNPVANNRKSKKLYTKWVEPLLNLAGIKVSLVETESPNQVFNLMKIMSNCDGVAIVGGDGTVHEAINGLLNRPDCVRAAKDIPIGIIPAGQYNSIARYVHQNFVDYRNQKDFLIFATMRLIESCTQKFDVIKINPIDEKNEHQFEPQTYALRDVRYGRYQDNFFKISGYKFYQVYIKPVWLRLQRSLSPRLNYPPPKIESIFYTDPCEGCSACYEKHKLKNSQDPINGQPETQQSVNRKWWNIMTLVSKQNKQLTEEERMDLERLKFQNPKCQEWIQVSSVENVTDFRACMMGDKKVRLSLSRNGEYNPSDITETQDIKLKLTAELDDDMKLNSADDFGGAQADKKDKVLKKKTEFLIDGQPSQAHSVMISTIDRAITIFTGERKFPTDESYNVSSKNDKIKSNLR